jgi:hypothetical protein
MALAGLGWGSHPTAKRWPLGVLWPPPTGQRIFLKKFDLAVGGGRSTPMGHGGGFGHPRTAGWGCPTPPHGLWGWIGHPQRPNQIFLKKILWPVGGGRSTPKGHCLAVGWPKPPQTSWGGRSHPHGQTVALGGAPATPRAISKTTKIYINFFLFF